tara:strand:+ start:59 stop:1564 length:1506 start_codon:yes stop_codon:yes gene_type:complete
MTDKIIFWMNGFFLNFAIAENLKKKYDCDIFAIIDITNRTKQFFIEQNLVNFKKIWFFHDHIQKNKKIDVDYLQKFEKKYSIDLWQLGFNERIFYQHNDFYKFSQNEILSILEKECKLYESILDEVKPDVLVIHETALHQEHLFYQLCRKRGIKVLMLNQSKIAYKCIISEELNKLDCMPKLSDIESEGRNFEELRTSLSIKDNSKQLKIYQNDLGGNRITKLKAVLEYFLKSNNSNIKTHFSYYGRSKLKVLIKYPLLILITKLRKSFIDKNLEYEIHPNEKFILFTLHQEPERVLLIGAPFYTNQLEIIRHIAKSLPIGFKLYVKEHFSQELRGWRKISYYKEILEIPNVRLYHPVLNIKELIEKSSLVISISGTSGLEAAFFQKPSVVMADLGYAILPSVQKLDSIENLSNLIKNGLDMKVEASDLDRYLTILEEHSFDFDLKGYELREGDFLHHGGNFQDTIITNKKMKIFLDETRNIINPLVDEYIKKLIIFTKNL